ncbi:L-threonylcarbamoyladenylate synthase [Rubrivivax gelatinosus]|uniref:L-threonylcarbamoyladenylate synthase n=2 Tax=Rubrivivax gelatinosus TaxID=28068 RepID=UPI0018C9B6DA|nr:L-threonylcarbamoyladenylate synthase [Rubrivivax gelatinosus]MBG6080431.1 L-threonylcarbamoyladenylate synthase [Rubrivivax gelatinosus]
MPILDGTLPAAITSAAERLRDGGLVAFPTETVYGLGARADHDVATAAVFAVKGRPDDHPLIVHVADAAAVAEFAEAPGPVAEALMARFWPGPLTLILRRREGRGEAAAGGQATIGIRMPSHPVAQALLREAVRLGVHGVAAPSANRFGRVSPTTAQHVRGEFGDGLLILDGGACEVGIESAIVDCSGERPALLRPGALDRREIEAVIGAPLAAPGADSPRASGTLESHYAPAAKVRLYDTASLTAMLAKPAPAGVAVYSRVVPSPASGVRHRPMPADPAAAAHELFAALRGFDAAGASVVWVEQPPAGPEWDGVRDRLTRAAAA